MEVPFVKPVSTELGKIYLVARFLAMLVQINRSFCQNDPQSIYDSLLITN